MILIAENVCEIVSSDLTISRPKLCMCCTVICVPSVVGSVAEWLRHPTGNLETQVQFLAEPHFHLIA